MSELMKELENKINDKNLINDCLCPNEQIKTKVINIYVCNDKNISNVRKLLCYYIESKFNDYVYEVIINKNLEFDEKVLLLNTYKIVDYDNIFGSLLVNDIYSSKEKILLIYNIIELLKINEYKGIIKELIDSNKSFSELLFIIKRLRNSNNYEENIHKLKLLLDISNKG